MAEVSVRVATLNIFNNPHGRWDDRLPVIADQLAELAPDVVAFQEVDRSGARAEAIARRVPGYQVYVHANPDAGSIKSLAILSRVPAETKSAVDLPSGDIGFSVEAVASGVRFTFATTHFLYRPTKAGGEIRLQQAAALLEWLEPTRQAGPVVVVGDFNALPTGATIAAMKQLFRSAHEVVHGTEPTRTHPTPLARSLDAMAAFGVPEVPDRDDAIDYIFVTEEIEVSDAAVAFDKPAFGDATVYPSDHYGLTATLQLPG